MLEALLAMAFLLPGDPPPDEGFVTVLGADLAGEKRLVVRGTLEKISSLPVGADMALVAVVETLWGDPPPTERIRVLSNEAGYFARVSTTAVFFLDPMEGGGRYSCRAVVDGGGADGPARVTAVKRSLEVERRPAAGRAAALRTLCFESLGAPDAWTRRNAGRETVHFAGIRPGAFSRADLLDLRKIARRARDPILRPLLVEAAGILSRAGEKGLLAPPDPAAVTLAGAPLLRVLRESADPKERRGAAEAAAREGPAGEAALIEAMATDPDGPVRAAAAEALGSAGTAGIAGPALLLRAKGDRDPAVRAAAIESLGLLRFAGGVDDLKAIAGAEPLLLRPCAFALARIRTEGALAALRSLRDGEFVDFLLSEDFVRQEEDLRRVRAAE